MLNLKATYTAFGKTKNIPIKVYHNGGWIESPVWDVEIWIERGEDWYALNDKSKKYRVIERDIWLKY